METDPWSKRQEKGHLDVLDGSVDCTAQEGEESQVAESSSDPRLRIPRAVPQGVHDPPHKIKGQKQGLRYAFLFRRNVEPAF